MDDKLIFAQDHSGNEYHAIIARPDKVRRGYPPIIGDGKSYYFDKGGYLELGTLGKLGSQLQDGFTLGLDIQSESKAPQIICGTSTTGKSTLILTLNDQGVFGRLRIEIRDDIGHRLIGLVQLSPSAAKRLIITAELTTKTIVVHEITLFETFAHDMEFVIAENLIQFNDFVYPLFLSGCNVNGKRKGDFLGRLAQIFFASRAATQLEILGLIKVTKSEIEAVNGIKNMRSPDIERRRLFKDDVRRLRKLQRKLKLSWSDALDTSLVIYRWLYDLHPMLLQICDEIGVQLSFPILSPHGKALQDFTLSLKPVFYQHATQGMQSMLGYEWAPAQIFNNETQFQIEGHSVTNESFIKFVRNKLGGGHYDAQNRKAWQKKLKTYSDSIQLGGSEAILYQMKMIIEPILQAVDYCGVIAQLDN